MNCFEEDIGGSYFDLDPRSTSGQYYNVVLQGHSTYRSNRWTKANLLMICAFLFILLFPSYNIFSKYAKFDQASPTLTLCFIEWVRNPSFLLIISQKIVFKEINFVFLLIKTYYSNFDRSGSHDPLAPWIHYCHLNPLGFASSKF